VPTSGVAAPDKASMPDRQYILHTIASAIMRLPSALVVRVGIDGIDGAGKSMFGNELAQILTAAGRSIIRASVDTWSG
jgi:uridine kinase